MSYQAGLLAPRRVAFVSLGCAKNLVDSEVMIGKLGAAGWELVPEAAEADAVVINTCAFIDLGEGRVDRRDPASTPRRSAPASS